MTDYTKHLSEPWFSLIKLRKKRVEGRLNKGDFSLMKKGDLITFYNDDLGFYRSYTVIIKNINHYDTFHEYLETETLKRSLPGIDTIEEGISVYRKYFSKEDEAKYKIIAIKINQM
jgi:ASC-1-like (ASCH) protein